MRAAACIHKSDFRRVLACCTIDLCAPPATKTSDLQRAGASVTGPLRRGTVALCDGLEHGKSDQLAWIMTDCFLTTRPIRCGWSLLFLAQLAEIFIQAGQNAMCLDVNRGGTNRNCCTQRLVVLRAQTY